MTDNAASPVPDDVDYRELVQRGFVPGHVDGLLQSGQTIATLLDWSSTGMDPALIELCVTQGRSRVEAQAWTDTWIPTHLIATFIVAGLGPDAGLAWYRAGNVVPPEPRIEPKQGSVDDTEPERATKLIRDADWTSGPAESVELDDPDDVEWAEGSDSSESYVSLILFELEVQNSVLPRRMMWIEGSDVWSFRHSTPNGSVVETTGAPSLGESISLVMSQFAGTSTGATTGTGVITSDLSVSSIIATFEAFASAPWLEDITVQCPEGTCAFFRVHGPDGSPDSFFTSSSEMENLSVAPYATVLSNDWSSYSGGPCVFDGWEFLYRAGTRYFIAHEGDDEHRYLLLGDHPNDHAAIATYLPYTDAWDKNEEGRLVNLWSTIENEVDE